MTTFWKTDLLWSKPTKPKKLNPETKIWTAFSKYIRLRDCLRTTGDSKVGKCCSSGELIQFNKSDAGHFFSRTHLSIKYDVRNVHLQSQKDNRFNQGNWSGYYDFMIRFYGKEIVDELNEKKNQIFKEQLEDSKYWNLLKRKLEKSFKIGLLGKNQLEIRNTIANLMKKKELENFLINLEI